MDGEPQSQLDRMEVLLSRAVAQLEHLERVEERSRVPNGLSLAGVGLAFVVFPLSFHGTGSVTALGTLIEVALGFGVFGWGLALIVLEVVRLTTRPLGRRSGEPPSSAT